MHPSCREDSATAIKKTGYKIYMELAVGTFKLLNDPAADLCGGQAVVMEPQAVDTREKGKWWAGGSTFPETWEKQLGKGSMECKAPDTPALQATDMGILAESISTAREGN
jgi:hypothetical protein